MSKKIVDLKVNSFSFFKNHPFHLVNPSPWPIANAISLFFVTTGLAFTFHNYSKGVFLFLLGMILVILITSFWFRDIIREATFQGMHTKQVIKSLELGVLLFIFSEIMLFVSFFWAFFHGSLAPGVFIGCLWPPRGILTFSPFEIPLLNTILLLVSGCTITASHYFLEANKLYLANCYLILTIVLGSLFMCCQAFEYLEASFNISDSIYGSVFYMLTGLHGSHVLNGVIFLIICLFRLILLHFTPTHYLGYKCAIWYWHFVDVVWIFVYSFIYIWGGFSF